MKTYVRVWCLSDGAGVGSGRRPQEFSTQGETIKVLLIAERTNDLFAVRMICVSASSSLLLKDLTL